MQAWKFRGALPPRHGEGKAIDTGRGKGVHFRMVDVCRGMATATDKLVFNVLGTMSMREQVQRLKLRA